RRQLVLGRIAPPQPWLDLGGGCSPTGGTTEDIAPQCFSRRRLIHHRPCFGTNIACQTLYCRIQRPIKEIKSRKKSCRKLSRMQIPALIDATTQMTSHQAGMELPGGFDVLSWAQGQDIGRAI